VIQLGEQCLNDQWPPKADRVVPTHVVNLDVPPMERWKDISIAYKSEVSHRTLFNEILLNFVIRLRILCPISKHLFCRFHPIYNFLSV
jgi:hypothetical protein